MLGIRREESSLWERRAPLSPNNVQSLVSKGAKVNGVCACITYMCVYVRMYVQMFNKIAKCTTTKSDLADSKTVKHACMY